jgi:hypothetical protein
MVTTDIVFLHYIKAKTKLLVYIKENWGNFKRFFWSLAKNYIFKLQNKIA